MYLPFYSEIKDIIKSTKYIRSHGGFIYGFKCVYHILKGDIDE